MLNLLSWFETTSQKEKKCNPIILVHGVFGSGKKKLYIL